jgi:hypothetical protein
MSMRLSHMGPLSDGRSCRGKGVTPIIQAGPMRSKAELPGKGGDPDYPGGALRRYGWSRRGKGVTPITQVGPRQI